jgi:hypothetical protein
MKIPTVAFIAWAVYIPDDGLPNPYPHRYLVDSGTGPYVDTKRNAIDASDDYVNDGPKARAVKVRITIEAINESN